MSQEKDYQKFPISGSNFFIYLSSQLQEIKTVQNIESQNKGSGIDFDTAIIIWSRRNLNCWKTGIF